jgi:hypothetical protein
MKKICVFFAALVFLSSAYGQDDQEFTSKSNELGAHLGATTGIGMSYRHWFHRVGFQLTVLPIKTNDYTFISSGITGLFSLKETKYIRAYLYLGNHFLYQETHNGDIMTSNTETTYEKLLNVGFGPGFSFGSIVGFNVMFGYGFYDLLSSFKMFPTGEIGVYYKF